MVKLQVVTVPGSKSTLVTQRLEELKRELMSSGNNLGDAGSAEDVMLFAEALFGRAPDDFLKRTSVDTLKAISFDASGVVAKYLAQKQPFSIAVSNPQSNDERATYSSIICVSTDRPFIIDTFAELLRSKGIKHHVMLHPLLKTSNGIILSLVYIEIDKIESEAELVSLQNSLKQVLSDVILITSDFEPLLSKARLARDWIKLLPPDPLEEDFERAEIADFLQWLIEEGFVFLGYREWIAKGDTLSNREVDLGLFQSTDKELLRQIEEVENDANYLNSTQGDFLFSKLNILSPVHRRTRLDLVTVRTKMNDETVVMCFLGLLTSKALSQEASSIPLIKRKIEAVLTQEGFLPNSHDYKELKSLIGTLPKGDLLQFSKDSIREDLQVMMGFQRRSETRVIVRDHSSKRFFSVSIFMPRDRFSSGALHRIQRYLKRTIPGYDPSYSYHVASNEDLLVALYFLVSNQSGGPLPVPTEEFERMLAELSLSWEEKLTLLLSREHGREKGLPLSNLYNQVFPDSYKASVSHRESLIDIQFLEQLSAASPLVLDLRETSQGDEECQLKLYKRGGHLTLSELLPYLENVGFDVISETVTKLSGSIEHREIPWGAIHTLHIKCRDSVGLLHDSIQTILLPGLAALILKQAENDELNSLLLNPGLTIREIGLMRTLAHYLWQLQEVSSLNLIAKALQSCPKAAQLIIAAFQAKFELSDATLEERQKRVSDIRKEFGEQLQGVSNLAFDKALRSLFSVVEAVVRTNFYSASHSRISVKIDCSVLSRMPEPRPLFEIFVCAPEFEGVHLRGGKVARGGIRWSERPDDFRTEIFGLMKTQMMKNAIIVPGGAKGGFVVKTSQRPSRDEVISCYKNYIRSLLEITDNLIQGQIVPPKDVVRFDKDDPYFVVAADKGTAALSDVANAIAQEEFQFWLGDAFASGGSKGYSHKSFGITAKGVWETTKRHFREAGIDISSQPFTVVGVGDMSGDVFGNGLLLSDNAKLVAAFDHRHIFLDPNPDPKVSFKERARLFSLPQSSWMDYDPKLISTGGGIFDRQQKEISLSGEMRKALDTTLEVVSGMDLMRLILKAPVDLFWNGGIGTYVKSAEEHNASVGDRANDDIRINGSEMRAKIVAEGGNLGFTQLGRVEYALSGGRINTDALDNSAGVNLSDLEVNIKILLKSVNEGGNNLLPEEERTKLLYEIADPVCERVLERNSLQSLVISTGVLRSKQNLTYYRGIISYYERVKLLDRRIDALPDDETLLERSKRKQGLLRPELAILLACTKMTISQIVLQSKLLDDPSMTKILFDYFPEKLQQRYPEQIKTHPLRREIIATQVANYLGERMGATFLYRIVEELGASGEAIIAAFLGARLILDQERVFASFERYDTAAQSSRYMGAILMLNSALDNVSRWILRGGVYGRTFQSISEIVSLYREEYHKLKKESLPTLIAEEGGSIAEGANDLIVAGFDVETEQEIASFTYAPELLDIVDLARETGINSKDLCRLYGATATTLKTRQLMSLIGKVEIAEHWDVTAQRTLESTVRSTLASIVREVLTLSDDPLPERLHQFLKRYEKGYRHYMQHLKDVDGRPMTVSALLVISNQLKGFWRD